jgi:hypothetical protein
MQISGPSNESQTRTSTNELDVDYVNEEFVYIPPKEMAAP